MTAPAWQSIIRFKTPEGGVCYGEPTADMKSARIWTGEDICSLTPTDRTSPVAEILAPYQPTTIIGIGVNYKGHAKETGHKLPAYPVVFRKMPGSVTGPFSAVALHGGDVDYENELAFVVSRPARDVPVSESLQYVLGFTVGNDVSSRHWQRPGTSQGQASYAKSFDGFCPIGPRLVSPQALPNYQRLHITTRRDGKTVQDSNTADMVFGVDELLSFLSTGTTLPAGTLVLTGTPPGVGAFEKPRPNFLKDGEVVECEIEGIGTIRNRFGS